MPFLGEFPNGEETNARINLVALAGEDITGEAEGFIPESAFGFSVFSNVRTVQVSLEGAEVLIPALISAIEKGSSLDVREFMIGMAHRGRLNVLANVLQKPYENIFKEFEADEYELYVLRRAGDLAPFERMRIESVMNSPEAG